MKISKDQLDNEINSKLEQLDNLRLNYAKENGSYVLYDGNKFYTGKVEFPKLTNEVTYFSSNSIAELKEHLYKTEKYYLSSVDNTFGTTRLYASNFKTLCTSEDSNFVCRLDDNILLFKEINAFYYVYTNSGKLYRINKNSVNTQTVYDILSILKTNFICPKLCANDILDFILYKDGFLLSTIENGVYYINFNTGHYELKFNTNNAVKIKELANGNIALLTANEKQQIILYDFDSGHKIEIFNNVRKLDNQIIRDALVTNKGELIVLGSSFGFNPSDSLLHYWKLDPAGISYENYDSIIGKNKASVFYEVKFIDTYEHYVYISGVYKSKLFIWVYDLLNLKAKPIEYMYDKFPIEYDDLNIVKIFGAQDIYFNIRNRLLKINFNGDLLENIKLHQFNTVDRIQWANNMFIAIDGKEAISYNRPSYNYYPEMKLVVYDSQTFCNNINIYMSSNNGLERAIFYDAESLKQIIPSYYGITESHESIINLRNATYKKIIMKVSCPKDTVINGLVVNSDNLYTK